MSWLTGAFFYGAIIGAGKPAPNANQNPNAQVNPNPIATKPGDLGIIDNIVQKAIGNPEAGNPNRVDVPKAPPRLAGRPLSAEERARYKEIRAEIDSIERQALDNDPEYKRLRDVHVKRQQELNGLDPNSAEYRQRASNLSILGVAMEARAAIVLQELEVNNQHLNTLKHELRLLDEILGENILQ